MTRSPLPGFVKVADSKPFRMDLPLDTGCLAPLARMMLRNYPTGTWSRKAHILLIVDSQEEDDEHVIFAGRWH